MDEWRAQADQQAGIVSRAQAMTAGMTDDQVRHRLRSGSWRALHPGVYVTHTGSVPFLATVWAALLHAGPDAVVSHRTAGHLQGLLDQEPAVVEVTAPFGHQVTKRRGVRIHRSRHLADRRHPVASLPQTRVEDTVLDLVDRSRSDEEVITLVLAACQRRLTTPARLAATARQRRRLRRRSLVKELLAEARAGVQSALERRYHRDVERAHGLPRAERQGLTVVGTRRWYYDVRYRRYRLRVQLEGLTWHPDDASGRDDARDNAAVVRDDDTVLRYGWRPVATAPCGTADEVATMLLRRGWDGATLRPCSAGCTAVRDRSA